ncbi:hypothetical protein ColTof4_03959 [Colletotrichum tofieldiae]|nr:hypothetical protein ColTof3_13805 [Colletotrichum tofieldiae]GKT71536.1 hypothetical protein ColTof4_03959 [Colletotrichum tofieldiae]GKT95303.1 hypothetical protein Ct61P_13153 [Colletotrichum tofieldiae]
MSSKYAFTKALKEVRFLFCQTGEHSAATRTSATPASTPELLCYRPCLQAAVWHQLLTCRSFDSSFVARAYPTMKKNNPQTPILLREAAGTLPKVYARYG